MTDLRSSVWEAILPATLPDPIEALAKSPANIALSKYWGKRDARMNLPNNSSLSISLGNFGTQTRVFPAEQDALLFNGKDIAPTDQKAKQVWQFVDFFRRGQDLPLRIETENSIPTAAGLASSASGFAALTRAMDRAFCLNLQDRELSMLARFGSGSASRSLWHGFVRWQQGERADGTDSHGVLLPHSWPEFRIGILFSDTTSKSQSSRIGMAHTIETSPLYPAWLAQTHNDCGAIESAIRDRDFARLGQVAEGNALGMHATMIAARPGLCYLKPSSLAHLHTLWAARDQGLNAFATIDAGPNIKLIFLAEAERDVRAVFPDLVVCDPFGEAPATAE